MTPVAAGPDVVPQVPVITTLPTVPLQHGVPPPMQLRPFGRQQLHRTPPPDLSTLQFPQQAPSVERQWPLRVLKYVVMYCLQNAVSDDPDLHVPDWHESGVVPKSVSPVQASPSSQVVAIGTPRQPGTYCVLLTATIPQ
jgi:hypothetical protein